MSNTERLVNYRAYSALINHLATKLNASRILRFLTTLDYVVMDRGYRFQEELGKRYITEPGDHRAYMLGASILGLDGDEIIEDMGEYYKVKAVDLFKEGIGLPDFF